MLNDVADGGHSDEIVARNVAEIEPNCTSESIARDAARSKFKGGTWYKDAKKKKKKKLGQYPAMLTSRLVNNAYVLRRDVMFLHHFYQEISRYTKR